MGLGTRVGTSWFIGQFDYELSLRALTPAVDTPGIDFSLS